jgi:hypothetical protein
MIIPLVIILISAALLMAQLEKCWTRSIGAITIVWIAILSWFLGAGTAVFFWMWVLK